jgi:non-ribosomal peptide synthetase component F
MLVLLNTQAERQSLAGLEMDVVTEDSRRSQFDLTLNVQEEPHGLRCAFEYNTDLFSAATMARMGQHFLRLLATVVADSGASIGSIRLIGDAERHHLLHALNATASTAPLEQGISALFEAQVAMLPMLSQRRCLALRVTSASHTQN